MHSERIDRWHFRLGLAAAVIGALGIVILPAANARGQESVLDEIKKRGELRVAGVTYRPFIYRRPSGQYVGIDVDVMGRIAKDLGVKLAVLDAEWATAVAGITTKKWDIVPATCITPKRLEVVDFTQSYLKLGGVMVFKTGNPKNFKTVEDFNKPEVVFAVPSGSWAESIAKQAVPKATLKGFGQTTSSDLVQEVLSGRADAVVLDAPVQTSLALAVYPNQLSFIPSATQPIDVLPCPVGYAYLKGDKKFGQYLDGYLSRAKASGELETLFKAWLVPEHIKPAN
jgi:ABC-type amino acid transport substrate-binding protein